MLDEDSLRETADYYAAKADALASASVLYRELSHGLVHLAEDQIDPVVIVGHIAKAEIAYQSCVSFGFGDLNMRAAIDGFVNNFNAR
jgi:hypothetical protein